MPWGPVVDGSVKGLPELPLTAMQAGRSTGVPMLLGSNLNEGSIFAPMLPLMAPNVSFPMAAGDFERTLHHILDNSTNTDIGPLVEVYPSQAFASETQRTATAIRDYIFLCPTRRAAAAVTSPNYTPFSSLQPSAVASEGGQAQLPAVPAYLYQFDYVNEWLDERLMGAYHTFELTFVWGNTFPSPLLHPLWLPKDNLMKKTMGQYWTNFAKFHDPNGVDSDNNSYSYGAAVVHGVQPNDGQTAAAGAGGEEEEEEEEKKVSTGSRFELLQWPRYDADTQPFVKLDVPFSVEYELNRHRCDVLDAFLGRR